jgi:hypothetical protein
VRISHRDNQTVTISNFDKRVLIEQVRYIEKEHALACDDQSESPDYSLHSNFEDRLWRRARHLVDCNNLRSATERAAKLSRIANIFAMILVGALGAAGITYAVGDDHTINIYWLLLVLLGFNLISMLIWLTGISLNLDGLIAGVLARLTSWLPDRLKTGSKTGTQANRAWMACHFGGKPGKWRFSKITHQLWLVYLFAGMVILTLILMVRQYDFVWGTTLLSDSAFVKLTDVMSMPLHALGFATPSVDQVQDTRIGASHILTAEHRNHWAKFLLGGLLCYGILPRMLLWIWSTLMSRASRRRFTLDYYLPYYISLRQQLMPLAGHGQIVDADASPLGVTNVPSVNLAPHQLPVDTKWVSVELGTDISWPPSSIGIDNDLGQVIDRESLARITHRLQHGANPTIAIAVDAARTTDRGVQRTITTLLTGNAQRWLVLLQHHEHEPISTTRLAAWYRLAEACKVPADHVISMNVA